MQREQQRSLRRTAGGPWRGALLLAALLVLGAAHAASTAELYSEDGDVQLIEGGQEAFKKAILSSHGAALVSMLWIAGCMLTCTTLLKAQDEAPLPRAHSRRRPAAHTQSLCVFG